MSSRATLTTNVETGETAQNDRSHRENIRRNQIYKYVKNRLFARVPPIRSEMRWRRRSYFSLSLRAASGFSFNNSAA